MKTNKNLVKILKTNYKDKKVVYETTLDYY